MTDEELNGLTLEDHAFLYARVLLAEILAAIIHTAKDDEGILAEITPEIDALRDQVGAVNLESFLKGSHEIWKRVTKKIPPHPYTHHVYRETRGDLRKALKKKNFIEELVRSALLVPSEDHFISHRETNLSVLNMNSYGRFTDIVLARFDEVGGDFVSEHLGLSDNYKRKLRRKIESLDMTMSELRQLCLVLGIVVEYDVKPYEENEESSPDSPSPDFPLAG